MQYYEIYFLVVIGIIISIVYPILRQAIPRPKNAAPALLTRIWEALKPYIIVLIIALISAPLVIAFMGEKINNYESAILAGFAWESILEKIKNG